MKKLHTFESFVPKNVDARKAEVEQKRLQKLAAYQVFIANFQANIQKLLSKKSKDPVEKELIKFFKILKFKDWTEKFCTFKLLNRDNFTVFKYDWQLNEFYYDFSRTWATFHFFFKMNRQEWEAYLKEMLSQYFSVNTTIVKMK